MKKEKRKNIRTGSSRIYMGLIEEQEIVYSVSKQRARNINSRKLMVLGI